jgi:xanthine dehydrogenase accessory factor
LAEPQVVRRLVSFAQAIFLDEWTVEGVTAQRIGELRGVAEALDRENIPILVDPECGILSLLRETNRESHRFVLVDARMTKSPPETKINAADLVIGLGPGFIAGENCHAVIETKRGHFMGRTIWQGEPEPDTGEPEGFGDLFGDRVLRSPSVGIFKPVKQICDHLLPGDLIAKVNGYPLHAPFEGLLRGLLYPNIRVKDGQKVGDLDPRIDKRSCTTVSDKSLAVGGGVLEAILSRPELREHLWSRSL